MFKKMTKKTIIAAAVMACSALTTANAGGILTNTNQNVAFLRNPAREAAIGIDGVYSNPAGVVFMPEGYHLSLNWQAAWQTRTIETTSKLLDHSLGEDPMTKTYKGNAAAPFLPSIQFAKNTGKWSFQASFAVTGGGGKCEFDKGLGSFESAVGKIGSLLMPLGVNGYDCTNYMQGKQYYFGFTLGAAYKITDNLSVYGGLRALYGKASYKAKIDNILVSTKTGGTMNFGKFIDAVNSNYSALESAMPTIQAGIAALKPAVDGGIATTAQIATYQDLTTKASQYQLLSAAAPQIQQLEIYRNGVNLQSDQEGFGIAPIIGVDWKLGPLNLAAKYEFRTKMSMENSSTVKQAMAIDAVNQFVDGTSVREDSPALLAIGAEWSILPNVRVNGGYHHFYDRKSKKYNNKQELLSSGTNEYLGGVEVDLTENLTVSGGAQITRYGNSDAYISDISFVVDSWSFGFGASYRVNKNVKLEAAYFKTLYDHYKTADKSNDFTRTNDVIGVGCDINF